MANWQTWVVILLLVGQAMLGALIASDQSLVSRQVLGWLAILNVGAGVLLNQIRALRF